MAILCLMSMEPPAARKPSDIVQEVLRSPDQMATTARLPPRLKMLEKSISAVADRVSRRYFTLLPIARSPGCAKRIDARGRLTTAASSSVPQLS